MSTSLPPLLTPTDPLPFAIHHPHGSSPFVFVVDHAGKHIPAQCGDLGLPSEEINRHIGWDMGIATVTAKLVQRLDAFAIEQPYSRLLIDCNRPLHAPSLIPETSDGTFIPGNHGLTLAQRQQRIDAIHTPYHARIAEELDKRQRAGIPTLLVMMHSFTPVMNGKARPWHAGVLYQREGRFAHALRAALQAENWIVGDNQPYAVSDHTDYAVPVHGEQRGLLHVALEIRQDLIAQSSDQHAWAKRLARIFHQLQPQLVALA